MMRKKRGYKREDSRKVRDYKLFAIACEGGVREPAYFQLFEHMSERIKVDIIEDIVRNKELPETKSAPKWVLDRAVKYIEKEGLIDEDELWFVMDIDKWKEDQLRNIANYCKDYPNWHIVLSNPCFEVWLYLHKRTSLSDLDNISCKALKRTIATFDSKGYHPYEFIPDLPDAIKNAKSIDKNTSHFLPKENTTKVYQLGEALLQVIGKNDFNHFLQTKLKQLRKIRAAK